MAPVVGQKLPRKHKRCLKVQLLTPKGQLPKRCSALSAGLDLTSAEDVEILARSSAKVPLDIAVRVPHGTYGRIAARSSMALRGLDVAGGVIDEDYTGPLFVVIRNTTSEPVQLTCGERIAQLILERISRAPPIVVEELPPTARGAGAFGSTEV